MPSQEKMDDLTIWDWFWWHFTQWLFITVLLEYSDHFATLKNHWGGSSLRPLPPSCYAYEPQNLTLTVCPAWLDNMLNKIPQLSLYHTLILVVACQGLDIGNLWQVSVSLPIDRNNTTCKCTETVTLIYMRSSWPKQTNSSVSFRCIQYMICDANKCHFLLVQVIM